MRKKKLLAIGLVFMMIGCLLISIPIYYEIKQNQSVNELEAALALVSFEGGAQGDYAELEGSVIDGISAGSRKGLHEVMKLEIPSIDLNQYVLSETNEENLNIALTQIKEKQVPGEGNFTIAGHRGYRSNRHFNNLPDVMAGDEIMLHTQDKTYVYRIVSSEVIAATHIEILNDDPEKAEITLITCTRDGKQRIAIQGEWTETFDRDVPLTEI